MMTTKRPTFCTAWPGKDDHKKMVEATIAESERVLYFESADHASQRNGSTVEIMHCCSITRVAHDHSTAPQHNTAATARVGAATYHPGCGVTRVGPAGHPRAVHPCSSRREEAVGGSTTHASDKRVWSTHMTLNKKRQKRKRQIKRRKKLTKRQKNEKLRQQKNK